MTTTKNRISETNGKAKTTPAENTLTIAPPNFQVAEFTIRGVTPYVQNKFSAKAKLKMKETQEAGSTARKGKAKEAKNFREAYEGAIHRFPDGTCGIPAPAFRNALISACRMTGYAMTRAKLSVTIVADGVDSDDGTPLVKITKGEPEYMESTVRLESGVCDIRPRPMWKPGWQAVVRVRFDADQFTLVDVANLMVRAGLQVGIGEGRNDSRKSTGQGWGEFEVLGG